MKKLLYWTLLILWFIFTILLSRQTGGETAELSGGITQWLCGVLARIDIHTDPAALHSALRTAAHILIYLVFGFLTGRAFRLSFRSRWLIVLCLLLCFALGVLDEYQKAFIPGRHCHWNEALLNCLLSVPGVLLGWLLPIKKEKPIESNQSSL